MRELYFKSYLFGDKIDVALYKGFVRVSGRSYEYPLVRSSFINCIYRRMMIKQ